MGVKPSFRALTATFQMRRDQFDEPRIITAVMSGLVEVGEKGIGAKGDEILFAEPDRPCAA